MECESRIAGQARVFTPHPAPPAVLGTSRIVDLMESAAARELLPRMRDGETSVAIATDLTHVAYPVAGALRVAVKEQGTAGRLHRFTVNVFDETGLIASATHSRAVITHRRLSGLSRRRAGKPSMQLDP